MTLLALLLPSALAWDACFPFDTPWEALATRQALGADDAPFTDFPSEEVHVVLADLEDAACAVDAGDTTTWACTAAADGVEASGTRTVATAADGSTDTTWSGVAVELDGDAAFATLDATAHHAFTSGYDAGVYFYSLDDDFAETGTVTWADGATETWTLARRRVAAEGPSVYPSDVVTVDYTFGGCRLWGSFGPQYDGVGIADVVDLHTADHALLYRASRVCDAQVASGDYGYVVGTWDGAPFSDVEPTEADPDLDGDLFTADGGDCDDAVAWVHACAVECVNGADDDCDGEVDEDNGAGFSTGCGDTDQDADGHVLAEDCDDLDPTVFEGCGAGDTGDTGDTGTADTGDTGGDTATGDTEDTAFVTDDDDDAGKSGGCGTPADAGAGWALAALALVRRRR